MALQREIQYINAYVAGTTALKADPAPVRRKKTVRLPKVRKERKLVIAVDPVAIAGIAVSLVLAVSLLISCVNLFQTASDAAAMENYVQSLQQENDALRTQYEEEVNLDEIRELAGSIGMVPVSQVPVISIDVPQPQVEQVPTLWDTIWDFVSGLFA